MSLSEDIRLGENDRCVIDALSRVYQQKPCEFNGDRCWASTREIAEICNINIYQARYSLLKLQSLGLVKKISGEYRTAMKWMLCHPLSAT